MKGYRPIPCHCNPVAKGLCRPMHNELALIHASISLICEAHMPFPVSACEAKPIYEVITDRCLANSERGQSLKTIMEEYRKHVRTVNE